jgi:hypothetical protein
VGIYAHFSSPPMWAPLMGILADPPPKVARHSCVRNAQANTEGKEKEQMNHYMGFDPYPIIKERNERTRREVQALHLGERLREARGSSSGTRFVALARRGGDASGACGAPRGVAIRRRDAQSSQPLRAPARVSSTPRGEGARRRKKM